MVAFPQTAPVPPAKDTGANYQLHPQSTGPYKFLSYQLNKQYTLVPNPQWNPSWDPQVKQLASKIIVNLNTNANDIDNRLLAGDIQMDQAGSGVQAAARARILSSNSLKANSDDPINGFMWFYYINTKVAPLNNIHCRMAVEFAANKTNLQTAYGGPYGGAIASTAIPPTVHGYSKFDLYNALSKPGGDVASAKAQLKLCGHPSGFSANIAYRSDRPREIASSQALQASLATVGIKATLKGYVASGYYGNFAGVPELRAQPPARDPGRRLGPGLAGWVRLGLGPVRRRCRRARRQCQHLRGERPGGQQPVHPDGVRDQPGHGDRRLRQDRHAGHEGRGAAAGGVLQGAAVP